MELSFVVGLVAFAAFLWLALRSGVDSRDTFRSKEEVLASYGVTWDELGRDQHRPAVVPVVALETPDRRRFAPERVAA
jgi:hypothetical protein